MTHGPGTKGAAVLRNADGDPMKIEQLAGRLDNEDSGATLSLQAVRSAWLARRFALAHNAAVLIAGLAFPSEARG